MNKQKGEGEVEFIGFLIVIMIIYGICVALDAGFDYCSKEYTEYQRKYTEYQRKIDSAHFSTFSQRAASYVPFATNESDKLALKIDELMATGVILKAEKEETRLAFNEYVHSINQRKDRLKSNGLFAEERTYAESLISQESAYRDKLNQKFESLRRATLEIDYLIEYARNRYKMLGSDKERSEMIDRIDSLTSKSRNGAQ